MSIIDSFDKNKSAIINPWEHVEKIDNFPEVVIATFSYKVMDLFIKKDGAKEVGRTKSVNGDNIVFSIPYKGKEIGFYMTPVGGAFAGGTLEEIIAMGAKKVIFYGSCGSLDKDITAGHIIVPTLAYRDEGLSYHYMEVSDYVEISTANKLATVLDELTIPYVKGKVWTTDGFYRETRSNMEKRKSEGCIAVDMECASLAAVSNFRNIEFYEFMYSADNLDSTIWEKRILGNLNLSERERYMLLAFEIALRV